MAFDIISEIAKLNGLSVPELHELYKSRYEGDARKQEVPEGTSRKWYVEAIGYKLQEDAIKAEGKTMSPGLTNRIKEKTSAKPYGDASPAGQSPEAKVLKKKAQKAGGEPTKEGRPAGGTKTALIESLLLAGKSPKEVALECDAKGWGATCSNHFPQIYRMAHHLADAGKIQNPIKGVKKLTPEERAQRMVSKKENFEKFIAEKKAEKAIEEAASLSPEERAAKLEARKKKLEAELAALNQPAAVSQR